MQAYNFNKNKERFHFDLLYLRATLISSLELLIRNEIN